MDYPLRSLPNGAVKLLPGLFQQRYDLNRKYMLSLKTANLLQNYYLEAGLWNPASHPGDIHWDWESPTCQLRGHLIPTMQTEVAEMIDDLIMPVTVQLDKRVEPKS